MSIPVTAIFDIGKTNKKFFLFDENYQEVYRDYTSFDLIKDEDEYPSDDLPAIQQWVKKVFHQILKSEQYDVKALNFSTYGATLVHIDRNGKLLTPLYNYTKPYPKKILESFYEKYGDREAFALETASPPLEMLNSGLQLYWLKNEKPAVYEKIWCSLHLPQYLSFLFTGIPVNEYTSTGCHTSLWDYKRNDYHEWVYKENINEKMPPVVRADTAIAMDYKGKKIQIGVGIHDSSSALIPYLRSAVQPFLLISTGTWSICINPFYEESQNATETADDCLKFMQVNGTPVRARRLFLGNEYKIQVEKLCSHFGKAKRYDQTIKFDNTLYQKLSRNAGIQFCFESLSPREGQPSETNLNSFENFEEAYHQLMIELMELQVISIQSCIGHSPIEKIYIDGGFTDNDIFVKLITLHFSNYKIRTTESPLGSALGASMVLSKENIGAAFLKENYALQKHEPLILD